MTETTPDSHLDPTSELNLQTVKKRAFKGVLVLTGRTLVLNLITFITQALLWAFIQPSEYGVFLLVSATVNFMSYFADIGLGAALIQKKDKPKEEDFRTVFLVQEVLVSALVIFVFAISPILAKTHSLSTESLNLLYALNISFFLASLKNIPSIILERKLEFGKFVIPQVIENLVYNVVLVYLAYKGFGITSFTYAVLMRGIVGLVAIYILQPWKPGLSFSKNSFRSLIRYGIPYQLNNFLATLKDDGMTIFVGGILGSHNLGILGVAQRISQYPLRFFMDNVNKVTFPAFSRMQDDKDQLSRVLSRSIFYIGVLTFPTLIGIAVLFPTLISVIPKYQKWDASYIPLLFLTVNSLWAATTTQLTNVLASTGRIKIDLKLMIMWTSLTWILVPYFSKYYGTIGASVAYALVGSSSIVAFVIVKKIIKDWSVVDSVVKPLSASILMGVAIFVVRNMFTNFNFYTLSFLIFIGVIVYGFLLSIFVGGSLREDVKKVFAEFIKRPS